MAAVLVSSENDSDRRASKDLPHLSLSLESPPSSSPFPSPSSSFVPPPMPGPHEYANKLPIHASKKKQRESADSNSSAPPTAPAVVATTPVPATMSSASPASANPSANAIVATNGSAKTNRGIKPPEEVSKCLEQLTSSTEHIDVAEPMRELRDAKRASRASLNSSRPAPPSPSVSRRASGANNLNNVSINNNGNSVSLSRANSIAATAGSAAASNTANARRRSRGIKIRDFAYSPSDLRHTGQGPDAPRPGYSRPASQYGEYGEDSGNNSRRNSGWGAFRWAGSRLWGFALGNGSSGNGSGKQRASASTDGFVPTSSDFARNFDVSSPQEEHNFSSFQGSDSLGDLENAWSQYSEEDEEELEADDSQYPDQDTPLLPGLYRAMYAFVPEGTAEMALAEDQVVRIVGRGGGVGWAVAVDEQGNHALVPESYLEVVQVDEDVELGED